MSRSPKYAKRFLIWFIKAELAEEVLGDLEEKFNEKIKHRTPFIAKVNYWYQTINYLRPFALKNNIITDLIQFNMFSNYFKLTLRNLVKDKTYATINLGGLAVGMLCSLLILLWIQEERSVDGFHENKDQLYQVYLRGINNGGVNAGYNSPALLPELLKDNIPEIEYASGYAKVLRLSQQGETYETFQVGEKIQKIRGSRAGTDFFQMFSYPLLYGTSTTALNEPNGVAISRKMANLFFGGIEAAKGKTLKVNANRDVSVTAIFEDLPSNASHQFDYLLNWDYWVENDDFKGNWGHFGTLTYVQLKSITNLEEAEKKMLHLLDEPLGIQKDGDFQLEIALQPFADQYLYSNFENGRPSGSRIVFVKLLGFIALFILFIAGINFTNLMAARSLRKSMEVSVRKVIGARKRHLVQRFLTETIILSFIALPIALCLLYFALPYFNQFTQKEIQFPTNPTFLFGIMSITFLLGLVAGLYPAFSLSSLQSSKVFKSSLVPSFKNIGVQKALITFQFTLAILLIIGTIIATQQTNYLLSKDMGYDQAHILYLPIEGTLVKNYKLFKEEASRVPGVEFIDRSSQTPHNMGFNGTFVQWEGDDQQAPVTFVPSSVGYDFIKLMDVEITVGRDFSDDFETDANAFIVNELAVQEMGLKDPVGTTVSIFGKTGPIVGVVADFHTQSLHQSILPTILDVKESLNFGSILIKTEAGKTKEALANLEKVYQQVNPGFPFAYTFMDDAFGSLYKSEQVVTKMSNLFGVLAILISCLGLLGLVIFATERRIKEIGIRKVLGASMGQIVGLFSKDFLKLVGLAFFIAAPIAYYLMDNWLADFAYHIDVQWTTFVLAGFVTVGIAFLIISLQVIKATLANPIEALKTE